MLFAVAVVLLACGACLAACGDDDGQRPPLSPPRRVQRWSSLAELLLPASSLTRNTRNLKYSKRPSTTGARGMEGSEKTNGSSDFDTHNIQTNGPRLVLDVKSELNGSRKGQHMANYYFHGSGFGQNLQFCPLKSTFWAQN